MLKGLLLEPGVKAHHATKEQGRVNSSFTAFQCDDVGRTPCSRRKLVAPASQTMNLMEGSRLSNMGSLRSRGN